MSDEQRFRDIEKGVHDLDKRTERVEATQEEFKRTFVDQLTLRDLDTKFDKRLNSIEGSMKDLSTGLNRMIDLNEEQMKKTAQREQESHVKELLLKQAEIDRIKQEAENQKFINKLKNQVIPTVQVIVLGGGTCGIIWAMFRWFVAQATP